MIPKKGLYFPAERLTGTEITVCDSLELDCYLCGVTPSVDKGEWALVNCEDGIKGSIVKFRTPANYFQACEIEIYGTRTTPGRFDIFGELVYKEKYFLRDFVKVRFSTSVFQEETIAAFENKDIVEHLPCFHFTICD